MTEKVVVLRDQKQNNRVEFFVRKNAFEIVENTICPLRTSVFPHFTFCSNFINLCQLCRSYARELLAEISFSENSEL